MKVVKGGCYCGETAFEITGEPRFVSHCHCNNCRHAHGAAFVTWAGYREGELRWTAGEEHLARYLTETEATRTFCSRCGTTMLFESPRWAGEVHVAVAVLENGAPKPPTGHAFADRAPDWAPIHDDLPRYGGEDGTTRL